jgi:hypothetical protein
VDKTIVVRDAFTDTLMIADNNGIRNFEPGDNRQTSNLTKDIYTNELEKKDDGTAISVDHDLDKKVVNGIEGDVKV